MHRLLISLFLIVFLTEIATDLYVPSLSLLPDFFSTDEQMAQATMSLHLFGFALGQPFWGLLSRRFPPKKTLLYGFGLFVMASAACALSENIQSLIASRFIQGLGGSCGPVIGLVLLKETSTDQTQTVQRISLLTMFLSASPILGPLLGGLILSFTEWQMNFYLLAFLGTLAWLSFWRESKPILPSLPIKNSPFPLSQLRSCFPWLLVNALLVSCVWIFITIAPLALLQRNQISPLGYGLIQAITVVFYILGNAYTHLNIKKQEAKLLLGKGFFWIFLSSTVLFFLIQEAFWNLFFFVSFFCLFEFGLGISRPILVEAILNIPSKTDKQSPSSVQSADPSSLGILSASIGFFEISLSACFLLFIPLQASLFCLSLFPLLALLLHFFLIQSQTPSPVRD